jgi:hypothetical protein
VFYIFTNIVYFTLANKRRKQEMESRQTIEEFLMSIDENLLKRANLFRFSDLRAAAQ